MELTRLKWDSDFFELPVYALNVSNCKELIDIHKKLIDDPPALVYIFLKDDDADLHNNINALGGLFYDTRIIYRKEIDSKNVCRSSVNCDSYSGEVTTGLINLAMQAGMYSRFHNDERLRPYFYGLYSEWVTNSLNKSIADETFIFRDAEDIQGFVSCRIKDKEGWVGLISVNPELQSMGIGTSLMSAVENYYIENQVKLSYVITQENNLKACRFYESCGYEIMQREFIYHLWI